MSIFVNTVDSIGDEALTNSIIDKSITEILDNYATRVGSYAFSSCFSLATADFQAATKVYEHAFDRCSSLTTVNLPVATSFDSSVFYRCSKLAAVILRSATMATLASTNVFDNTPIKSGTGYIYVPAALVDSYKAARNWSTYANQFRALEDYTVDGTTTGALDESKI